MANWYCDPSLPIAGTYNAAPVAAGTVPTKPDDGDGKASGTAVMASGTITIGTNLNSGDTVSFNGKTFTAGTDFTIGGSASVTATNIAAAINALASTSTWTVGNGYQFRDLFNACVSGAVVTVYTRIGSADWNAVAITTSSGGRATTSGFSGGASGAFGWLLNTASITWPSGAKAKGTFGVLVAEPVGYIIANGDKVDIRSGNGTIGTTLAFAASAGYVVSFLKRGTASLPVVFVIDDGSIWATDSGDNAQLAITFDIGTAYESVTFGWTTAPSSATDGGVHIKGKINGDGSRNLAIKYKAATGYSIGTPVLSLQAYVTLENVETFDGATTNNYGNPFSFTVRSYSLRRPRFINHKHSFYLPWNYLFTVSPAYETWGFEWIGGELQAIGLVSAPANALFYSNYSTAVVVDFKGTKFTGFPPGCLLWKYDTNQVPARVAITLADCQGAENWQTLHGACFMRTTGANVNADNKISLTGIAGNGYVQDTVPVHASWLIGLGFPYLNGLAENNQPASIRIELSTSDSYVPSSGITIFDTLVFSDHSSDAAKTLTAQVAIDENLSYDTATMAMHVMYQDAATGASKYVTTLVDRPLSAALTSSTDTWYPESSGRPFYTEGVAKYYNKFKLSLTTPTSVKQHSMMRVWLTAHKPITATARYIFVDPYITVA